MLAAARRSRPATARALAVARRIGVAALISVPAFAAGARIVRGGLAALAYDECEYAWQMLAIADSLVGRGLLAGPEVMALHQSSAKPPLLVDVAAVFSLLLGPARTPYAIAATMAVTNA